MAYQIKFIDSLRHMQQSLSNLVDNLDKLDKNLPDDVLINKFYNTYQFCDNSNFDNFELLLRKGVYPYDYMDTWKKYNEPVPLMKEVYYKKYNGENISNSNLEHVKKCM